MAGKKNKTKARGWHDFTARREERRRRKKMQAYLHGDVSIPPSAHGRISVQIGWIVFAIFLLLLLFAYLTHGKAVAVIGAIGLIAVILNCLGIFQGLVGFSEKGRDRKPCKRGIALNLILLILLILLFFTGLRS